MDFLNEFSKKVSSVARSVTEKSKETAEVSRLNAELRDARDALEKLRASGRSRSSCRRSCAAA